MWPLLIGLGAYMIAKGIQEGINENSKDTLALPPGDDPLQLTDDGKIDIPESWDIEDEDYDRIPMLRRIARRK